MNLKRWAMMAVALPVLFMVGFWLWLGSDSGHQWLIHSVAEISDGSVEIRGLNGHPLSALDVETILYKDETAEVMVDSVHLAWMPLRLLFTQLSVSDLSAESVQVRLLPGASETEQPASSIPPLPGLILGRLRIGSASVEQTDGSILRLEDIRGEGLRLIGVLGGSLQAHIIEPDAHARVKLGGTMASWQVEGELAGDTLGKFNISLSGNRFKTGDVRIEAVAGENSAVLEGDWKRLGNDLNTTAKLQINTEGADFNGTLQLTLGIQPELANWKLEGVANSHMLSRDMPLRINGHWADAAVWAMIEELGQGLRLELQHEGQQATGKLILKDWSSPLQEAPGRLDGQVSGSWQINSGRWKLNGDIDKGELAGVVAKLKLDGEGDGSSWQLKRADVEALGLHLSASGKGDAKRFNLAGKLAGKNIAPAMKLAGLTGAGGGVVASFGLAGDYENPQVNISATATALKYENITADRLELSGNYRDREGRLKLRLADVAVDGAREIVQLTGTASLKGEALTLSLKSQGRIQGKLASTAHMGSSGIDEARLRDLRLAYDGVTLLEAKQLIFKREGKAMRLEKTPLKLMGAASTCEFSYGGEQVLVHLDVTGLQLSGAEPWLRNLPYRLGGHADLSIHIVGKAQAPQLVMRLNAPELKLGHAMFAGEEDKILVLSHVSMQSTFRDRLLSWKLHATAPAGGLIESNGSYGLLFSIDPWQITLPQKQDGSGRLLAKFTHLSDLQPLMPRIEPFDGSGTLELNWRMPLDVNSVRGDGHIRFDALGVPEFGLDMKGDMLVRLANGKPVIDLRLQGGDGELSIKGDVDVDRRIIPDIRFSHFPLMNLPDQQLTASGTISASGQQQMNVIAGHLEVERMRLEIPEATPKPTSDLQWEIESADDMKKTKPPLSKIDVVLKIGTDAEIYGRGMSLKPTGELELGGSLSQPQLTGVLDIASGKIEFRSIKLGIQSGSYVVFAGDPTRPTIYISAARKVGDVLAGIVVSGPADQLTTQLYSTPAMRNSEIFSYIATGRPLATLGKDNTSDMMTAAEFILGPGTMMQEVQGKVKQATGLDIFEVGGDSSGGYVRAGRKISDKVTLTVEQAVSKESSTALTLEYLLTQSFSIFAKQTTNLAPSIGIRYNKTWFGSLKTKAEVPAPVK